LATQTQIARSAAELRAVLGQLVRRFRSEYTTPIAQATVLGRLDREGPRTTSELAAAEHMRPQSMAQILAELEAEGCIVRRADSDDRRQVLIELSEHGRERIRGERSRRDDWFAATIAAELTPEEQDVLVAALPLLRRISES
jgi:DNA-binding MarR family transcriptional regulator